MTVRDDVIVVLATARLTRLVTEDEITRPLRARLAKPQQLWTEEEAPPTRLDRLQGEVEYLVNCRYCVGIWAAGAVMLMQKHPAGRTVNMMLAAAGAGNLVHRAWDL